MKKFDPCDYICFGNWKIKIVMSKKRKVEKQPVNLVFYIVFIVLINVLPLFFLPQTIDKVLMPRLLLVNGFLVAFYIYWILKRTFLPINFSVLRNFIFPTFALLSMLTFASQFVAINFAEGNFDTVKSFTTVILLFTFVQVLLNTSNWQVKLTQLVVISAILSAGFGYYDYLIKVVPNPNMKFNTLPAIYRVMGLFAHKNQLSIALALQIPFLIFGIMRLKSYWRIASVVALIMSLGMILLLETRSVILALGLSSVTTVFVLILWYKKFNLVARHRKILFWILIGGFFSATALMTIGLMRQNAYAEKIKTIAEPDNPNNIYRLKVWNLTLKICKKQPLIGVGAGNWKLHAPKYHADAGIKINQSNWIRPHNDFLWVLAEKGIPGFILFISLFMLAFYQAFKVLIGNAKAERKIFVLLISGGVLTYIIISFFTFPLERINHQVYLAVFMAIIMVHYHEMYPGNSAKYSRFVITVPALLLSAFGVFYSLQMVNLETHMRIAKVAVKKGEWQKAIEETQQAGTILRNIDPENVPCASYLGSAYNGLGNYKQAILHYKIARKASPNNALVLNDFGQALINQGKNKRAKQVLNRALTLYPYFPEAMVNQATCLYNLGEYDEALELLVALKWRDRNDVIRGNIKALRKLIREEKQRKTLEQK